jgi:arginine repressor
MAQSQIQIARDIQKDLQASIKTEKSGIAKAQLARAWKELELMKREIHKVNKEARARQSPRSTPPTESPVESHAEKKESTWPKPPSPHHPPPTPG